MNLAHGLYLIVERVVTGRQEGASRALLKDFLLSISDTHLLQYFFMQLRHLGKFSVSVLYGLCNFPSPSFPFNKTRLKDLSASSEPLFFFRRIVFKQQFQFNKLMSDWNKQYSFPNNSVSSNVATKMMQLTCLRIISGPTTQLSYRSLLIFF